jgi:hypothetical protein
MTGNNLRLAHPANPHLECAAGSADQQLGRLDGQGGRSPAASRKLAVS